MLLNTFKNVVAYLALLLPLCVATTQAQNGPVKNVVLVHGAWADGSGWRGVYDILVKDGCQVSIVQEPETSFKDDVAATKRILALQEGPCILVAHSYGDAVIAEAGTQPSVAGLVYVAAHMPDAGESEAQDGKRDRVRFTEIAREPEAARRFRVSRPRAILNFADNFQPSSLTPHGGASQGGTPSMPIVTRLKSRERATQSMSLGQRR